MLPGEEKLLGWVDPLGEDADRSVTLSVGDSGPIQVDPHAAQTIALGEAASVSSRMHGSITLLSVGDKQTKTKTTNKKYND